MINLFNGAALRLRNKEEASKEGDESDGAEYEANLATEIACIGIEHVRKAECHEPRHECEDDTGQGLRLGSQLERRDFPANNPSNAGNCGLIDKGLRS
jgi:hypothetical protein